MQINRMGNAYKSVKQTAKHLKRRYSEAFEDFLGNKGLMSPKKMEAYKVAAMFKAGNMTCRKNRRGALQVLQNHFGNQAFDSEANFRCYATVTQR